MLLRFLNVRIFRKGGTFNFDRVQSFSMICKFRGVPERFNSQKSSTWEGVVFRSVTKRVANRFYLFLRGPLGHEKIAPVRTKRFRCMGNQPWQREERVYIIPLVNCWFWLCCSRRIWWYSAGTRQSDLQFLNNKITFWFLLVWSFFVAGLVSILICSCLSV